MFDIDPDAPETTTENATAVAEPPPETKNLPDRECSKTEHRPVRRRDNFIGNSTNRPVPAVIDFFGDKLVALAHNGEVVVQLKSLCDSLEVSYCNQYTKIRNAGTEDKFGVRHIIAYMPGNPRPNRYTFMTGRGMLYWLLTLKPGKVTDSKRDKIIRYQTEALDVLERHFFGDKRPTPAEPQLVPAPRNGFVETVPSDDPIVGALNMLIGIRQQQLADQQRITGIEADVKGVQSRIGDIEGTLNDNLRRLNSIEGRLEQPVPLQSAPEPWYSVGDYLRRVGREMSESDRFKAGGDLFDMMADRGLKIRVRQMRGYKQNTYPLPILKEYFGDE